MSLARCLGTPKLEQCVTHWVAASGQPDGWNAAQLNGNTQEAFRLPVRSGKYKARGSNNLGVHQTTRRVGLSGGVGSDVGHNATNANGVRLKAASQQSGRCSVCVCVCMYVCMYGWMGECIYIYVCVVVVVAFVLAVVVACVVLVVLV